MWSRPHSARVRSAVENSPTNARPVANHNNLFGEYQNLYLPDVVGFISKRGGVKVKRAERQMGGEGQWWVEGGSRGGRGVGAHSGASEIYFEEVLRHVRDFGVPAVR